MMDNHLNSIYPANHSRSTDSDRLIKQTYSVHVSLLADRPHGIVQKWYLSKYTSCVDQHPLYCISQQHTSASKH
jgi:hypothetical protein